MPRRSSESFLVLCSPGLSSRVDRVSTKDLEKARRKASRRKRPLLCIDRPPQRDVSLSGMAEVVQRVWSERIKARAKAWNGLSQCN